MTLDNTVKTDGTSTQTYTVIGKWNNASGKYTCNLLGIGEVSLVIENDTLLIWKDRTAMKCRKIIEWNPYTDLVIK